MEAVRSLPKNHRWLLLINAAALATVGAVLVPAVLSSPDTTASTDTAACARLGTTHRLVVNNDSFSEPRLAVQHCDTVIITNQDDLTYELNFGQHDRHIFYPGFTSRPLLPGKSTTIHALRVGTFHIHDHLRDNAELELVVQPN
jgi:hypothetical protein